MQGMNYGKTIFVACQWFILIAVGFIHCLFDNVHPTFAFIVVTGIGGAALTLLSLRAWKKIECSEQKYLAISDGLYQKIDRLSDEIAYLRGREDVMQRVIAIIGHDIRTPIANLNIMVRGYLNRSLEQEIVSEFIPLFEVETSSMLELVNRLLHWVEMNTSDAIVIEPIDLRKELTKLLSMYHPVALRNGVNLVNNVSEDIIIYHDPAHLNVVLRNLVDNAVKYTSSGGQVVLNCVKHDVEMYRMFVSNTVVGGIRTDLIHELQFTNNTVNNRNADSHSTGLGIFFIKEYLRKLGSHIQIENGPMNFITFSFDLRSRLTAADPTESSIGISKREIAEVS